MSTFEEIVGKLATIKTDLDAIDLTKEKDLAKIEKMGKQPITSIDNVIGDEGFREEHLEATIEMFKDASNSVGAYDKKQDIEAGKKVQGDPAKLKEISDRMKARQTVKEAIQGKYSELSMKKAVIDKYKEKFDPKHLVERENRKKDANKKKIEDNQTKISEIAEFKNKVSGELGVIETNLALIEQLDKLEKLAKDIETRENNLNNAKTQGLDPDLIKGLEEDLNESKNDLKVKTAEVTKKHKGLALDPNDLVNSIGNARTTAKNTIAKEKDQIKNKAQASDKDYIKTEIYGKLDKAYSNDEAFIKVLDGTTIELDAENITLEMENEKIAQNVGEIELGTKVKESIANGTMHPEITDADIQAKINSDSSLQALIPALSDKEKKQAVYESLVEGAKRKNKFLHPIAAFKAQFSKKTMQEWENTTYNDEMKRRAIELIEEERGANLKALQTADSKEVAFRKGLFAHVMSSTKAEVEQMDKDADKNPGTVLAEAYAQVQDDDEPTI